MRRNERNEKGRGKRKGRASSKRQARRRKVEKGTEEASYDGIEKKEEREE